MNRQTLYQEYDIDNPPPTPPRRQRIPMLLLAAGVLCAVMISAHRTVSIFSGENPSSIDHLMGIVAVGMVELMLITGGYTLAEMYRGKRARQIQLAGMTALIVLTAGIAIGGGVYYTLNQLTGYDNTTWERAIAVLIGVDAPLFAFFGMKQLPRWEATINARYRAELTAHTRARRDWTDAQLAKQPTTQRASAPKAKAAKRNPNAKSALIDLIRRNEIQNWQDLSGRELSRAAAALGVQVGKETARKAKGELLNGH